MPHVLPDLLESTIVNFINSGPGGAVRGHESTDIPSTPRIVVQAADANDTIPGRGAWWITVEVHVRSSKSSSTRDAHATLTQTVWDMLNSDSVTGLNASRPLGSEITVMKQRGLSMREDNEDPDWISILTMGYITVGYVDALDAPQILTTEQINSICAGYFTTASLSYLFTDTYLFCVPAAAGVPLGLPQTYAQLNGSDVPLQYGGQNFTLFGWYLPKQAGYGAPMFARDDVSVGTEQYQIFDAGNIVNCDAFDSNGNAYQVSGSIVLPRLDKWHMVAVRYNATTRVLDLTIDDTRGGSSSATLAVALRDGLSTTLFGAGTINGVSISDSFYGGLRNWGWCKGNRLSDSELTSLFNGGIDIPYADIPTSIRSKITNYWQFGGFDYALAGHLDSVGTADLFAQTNSANAGMQTAGPQAAYKNTGVSFWVATNGINNLFAIPGGHTTPSTPMVRSKNQVDFRLTRHLRLQDSITQGTSGYIWAIVKVPGAPVIGDKKMILHGGANALSCMVFENKPQITNYADEFGNAQNAALSSGIFHLVEWRWWPGGTSTRVDGAGLVVDAPMDTSLFKSWTRVGENIALSTAGFELSLFAVSNPIINEQDRLNIEATFLQRVAVLNA